MRGAAAYVEPFFGILVAHGHDHPELVLPARPQLHHALVNLHGNGTTISDHERLARQNIRTVILIVTNDVCAQGINGFRGAENGVKTAEITFAFCKRHLICLVSELVIGGVQCTQRLGV